MCERIAVEGTSRRSRPLLFLALAESLVWTLACGPIVMIPGGELDGTPTPPPSDWSFSDSVDTIQLETRPSAPYSVNLWGVAVGSAFYVAAGDGEESTWARNIQVDPEVRLRIENRIYEMRATRVDDEAEKERVLSALKAKYDFEPEPDERSKAWLFRLDPR